MPRTDKSLTIHSDTATYSDVYTPELSFARLYTNDTIEISVICEGTGVHQISNRIIPCKEGDAFVVQANVHHGYFCSERGESLTVRRLTFSLDDWFSGEAVSPDSTRFCFGVFNEEAASSYAMLNSQTKKEIHALCDAIEREVDEKKSEWQECTKAHLTLLLVSLARYVNRAIKNVPVFPPKDWETMSGVLRIISERFGDSTLTLEDLSAALFVSRSHLSRLFGKLTGYSFSEYLKNVRLGSACELLRETELRVEEIVERCGLRDLPSFYKNFHAYANMTPSQYRNKYNSHTKQKNEKGEKIMIILSEISENLQKGKAKIVKEMVEAAIAEGCEPEAILNEGLLSGMNVIGEKFKNGEVYVPEVLVAARAMNMGVGVLKPHLVASGVKATGKVCIGTVQGDLHDIGKNLVKLMMEGKGLEVVDLGTDVAPETFVETAINEGCQVICCSALLTTTMDVMASVVKAAEAAGIRDKVKIMIGGAPISQDFCDKIGADCYTVDAASAADAAVEFCK
ncbi:MAG: helix-turn-helix domain-containing protein [Ruminococcaceae bacterium]|nr:helix-turn-helix domain-containing protein [Oscillospiraceae bacterium]